MKSVYFWRWWVWNSVCEELCKVTTTECNKIPPFAGTCRDKAIQRRRKYCRSMNPFMSNKSVQSTVWHYPGHARCILLVVDASVLGRFEVWMGIRPNTSQYDVQWVTRNALATIVCNRHGFVTHCIYVIIHSIFTSYTLCVFQYCTRNFEPWYWICGGANVAKGRSGCIWTRSDKSCQWKTGTNQWRNQGVDRPLALRPTKESSRGEILAK